MQFRCGLELAGPDNAEWGNGERMGTVKQKKTVQKSEKQKAVQEALT
jgi:hypothetical protein